IIDESIEKQQIIDFIRTSDKGIIRGPLSKMLVQLNNIGRRFKKEWIFRNTTIELDSNSVVAVEGPNGSGKSTLLKIISGSDIPSEGEIIYKNDNKQIHVENIYKYVSYAAPYIDLPEQFTLWELINFQKKLKNFIGSLSEN